MTTSSPTIAANVAEPAHDHELLRNLEDHLVVDTSEHHAVYLLAGRNGRHIRLSASAVQLLRQVARGASFEDLAEALGRRDARSVAPADVEAAHRKLVEQIAAIEAQGDNLHGAFWLRRTLVPGPIVARIARGCAAMFHPAVAACFVAAIVAVAAIAGGPALGHPSGLGVDAGHFWPAYGLFLASLVAHEIGHASACARYGAGPREIGVALYVIYPVFYSNVSAAWTLKRWQRVVVDLGGVYFQLVVGAAYALGFAVSGWEPLRVAVLFILGSCLFSLNPILKFDGYWVVADALGVTNLARQPPRILRHLAARLRGRPVPALPWPRSVTGMLALYSVMSIGFWAWFLWKIVPALVPQAIDAARVVAALIAQLIASPAWPGGGRLQEAAAAGYILLLAALVSWRLLRGVIRVLPVRGAA
jgi:putative peptide zinc metalloprotease protein